MTILEIQGALMCAKFYTIFRPYTKLQDVKPIYTHIFLENISSDYFLLKHVSIIGFNLHIKIIVHFTIAYLL